MKIDENNNAVLNIDLDFFTEPAYAGDSYLFNEFRSYSDFFAKAKIWIKLEEFLDKMQLKRTRGCIVGDDRQVLFAYEKILKEEFIKPNEFYFINVDAHHDMYNYHDMSYYDTFNLSNYRSYNSLIAMYKKGWVTNNKIIWVYPDYIPKDSSQLDLSLLDFKNKKLSWSNFSPQMFNFKWKYISLVLNKHMCLLDKDILIEIKKFISEW